MASYQGYSEHYHQQPQVYNYESTPIPKPTEYSDLEAVRRQNYNPASRHNEKREEHRRICGLRVVTFWLALALVVVIIVAAVGGGVGGALATKGSSASPTTTATVTETAAAPAVSSTVPSTGFARLYCTKGGIYTAPDGSRFKQRCATDWASDAEAVGGGEVHDLEIRMAATFHSCMDQCAARNKNQPGLVPCGAVAYDADLTETIEANGGNCWLKDHPATENTLPDDGKPAERYAVAALLN